ncbi:hypothetical protein M422DRAFT_253626 [Sphaerobolus stellatus SS14]|uniref:Uncharacterized protein n=1 Tax=Sphaerobolus stellatus (strain SS14) TaxID=990650 RepID=A0A0C9VMM3_SPHS4|nr:hypothetical protein M422DRAFT_253626 [Sphaerobolus stellatus SS14]
MSRRELDSDSLWDMVSLFPRPWLPPLQLLHGWPKPPQASLDSAMPSPPSSISTPQHDPTSLHADPAPERRWEASSIAPCIRSASPAHFRCTAALCVPCHMLSRHLTATHPLHTDLPPEPQSLLACSPHPSPLSHLCCCPLRAPSHAVLHLLRCIAAVCAPHHTLFSASSTALPPSAHPTTRCLTASPPPTLSVRILPQSDAGRPQSLQHAPRVCLRLLCCITALCTSCHMPFSTTSAALPPSAQLAACHAMFSAPSAVLPPSPPTPLYVDPAPERCWEDPEPPSIAPAPAPPPPTHFRCTTALCAPHRMPSHRPTEPPSMLPASFPTFSAALLPSACPAAHHLTTRCHLPISVRILPPTRHLSTLAPP